MVRRAFRFGVVLSLGVAVFGGALPAQATTVCLENNVLRFDPPLDIANQAGTVLVQYETTCADAPGLSPNHYSGSVTLPYFGSCALTLFAEGIHSSVVAGTAYTVLWSNGTAKALTLQPNSPCPISSAHGTGVLSRVV